MIFLRVPALRDTEVHIHIRRHNHSLNLRRGPIVRRRILLKTMVLIGSGQMQILTGIMAGLMKVGIPGIIGPAGTGHLSMAAHYYLKSSAGLLFCRYCHFSLGCSYSFNVHNIPHFC